MVALVAKKLGMSRIYSEDGRAIPVTLVRVYDACVSNIVKHENKDFNNIVLSFDKLKSGKNLSKSVRSVYEKQGLAYYRHMKSFQVPAEDTYKIGDVIGINKVKKDTFVDVRGVSIGKGFAGGMKRHGFGGLEATHGVSISHRSHGSTGQCQDPGRVFKGKKMAGHMGNKGVTVKNLAIIDVIEEDNVVCINGSIPGSKGCDVILKPSL